MTSLTIAALTLFACAVLTSIVTHSGVAFAPLSAGWAFAVADTYARYRG